MNNLTVTLLLLTSIGTMSASKPTTGNKEQDVQLVSLPCRPKLTIEKPENCAALITNTVPSAIIPPANLDSLLQNFKREAKAITDDLEKNVHDPESMQKIACRDLDDAYLNTIKQLPRSCHIEISTERGIFARKIIHTYNKAVHAKIQRDHEQRLRYRNR